MSKKFKIEIEQKDIENAIGNHIQTLFTTPAFTQTVHDAVNAKLDNFAFQQRLLYDERLQKDVEQMVKKLIMTPNTEQIHRELDPDGILTVLRKYDPDVLLKLINQIKEEK